MTSFLRKLFSQSLRALRGSFKWKKIMKPIIVLHKGIQHQVLEVSKPLYNSSLITNVINTGGRLAVNLETNELTIIRGDSVVDFHKQIADRSVSNKTTKAAMQEARDMRKSKIIVDGQEHWSAPHETFMRAKENVKKYVKAFIDDGRVVEIVVGEKTYVSTSKAFWMHFARIK